MQDWKQALRLAMFELHASKYVIFFLAVILCLALSSIVTGFSSYLEKNYAGIEFTFFIIFSAIILIWVKPKDFQLNQVNEDVMASPSLIMLHQLAVKKDVMIKSRFIVHFCYSFPFQLLFLIFFYALSQELQHVLPVGSYLAFSIIWLSFSFYAGYFFMATDAGTRNVNKITAALFTFIFAIGVMFLSATIQTISGHGIVNWTIIFAQEWPLLSSIISVILAVLGFSYWLHYMRKTMDLVDYL
ncbi:hypothetical protein F3157_14050 [Virgibacillus dakarensis]|uniref:Uncharacterized protein n=1 Tax=Lentibacillus populi TaxID=1827502 RepID=A0A9W5X4Z5_9BACI|nr:MULTISPECIES: hypothetical protein [Bacillaceae]MBT2217290.1 hypothetical protein [Virgibacillus dakarensis]MTW86775.1 hypothetical protein [Virgibacillus dakarensis]GGB38265.1 hypothetical protein GCM10011409_14690 [Lentibacillus populi]